MLVGLQPIYLLNVLDISSKSSCANLCHFKKSKFSFTKTSSWKFFDPKPTHFAVRIAAPLGNNRSAAEELGERVLYFRNTSTQICRYIESYKPIFLEMAETILRMLLICGFAVDFNFFYRKSANVYGKKSVCKSANLNLESAICGFVDLRTCLRKCPALDNCTSSNTLQNQFKNKLCLGAISLARFLVLCKLKMFQKSMPTLLMCNLESFICRFGKIGGVRRKHKIFNIFV